MSRQPVDVTLRIAGFQIEQGGYASDLSLPQRGHTGPVKRYGFEAPTPVEAAASRAGFSPGRRRDILPEPTHSDLGGQWKQSGMMLEQIVVIHLVDVDKNNNRFADGNLLISP